MTPEEIRHHATEIILDHARDVEFLSISEYLADCDINDLDDETARAIDDAIREATVTVEFPEPAVAAVDGPGAGTDLIDPLADALRGPWVAVIADRYGWLIDPDDLDESYTDGATVQIVRRSAAPGAREDGETDRLPGTYLSADHLVTFDDYDDPGDIWAQAQAMVAGLNAAAGAEKVTR